MRTEHNVVGEEHSNYQFISFDHRVRHAALEIDSHFLHVMEAEVLRTH
jgi:hypothetical protein